jgi:hypothetical protein
MKPITQVPAYRSRNNSDHLPAGRSSRVFWTDYNFQESGFDPFGHSSGGWFRKTSSIHLISRDFFRREFFVEAIVFGCIILVSAWPVTYLIEILTGLIK